MRAGAAPARGPAPPSASATSSMTSRASARLASWDGVSRDRRPASQALPTRRRSSTIRRPSSVIVSQTPRRSLGSRHRATRPASSRRSASRVAAEEGSRSASARSPMAISPRLAMVASARCWVTVMPWGSWWRRRRPQVDHRHPQPVGQGSGAAPAGGSGESDAGGGAMTDRWGSPWLLSTVECTSDTYYDKHLMARENPGPWSTRPARDGTRPVPAPAVRHPRGVTRSGGRGWRPRMEGGWRGRIRTCDPRVMSPLL